MVSTWVVSRVPSLRVRQVTVDSLHAKGLLPKAGQAGQAAR